MRRGLFSKSRTVTRFLAAVVIGMIMTTGGAWGGNQPPLNRLPVPEPPNISQFVKDKTAAIRLGKALFWDMQAGSDGVTACATCHYRAGADPIDVRSRNQLNPGPDGSFQVGTGPNYALQQFPDFPFFQLSPVDAQLVDLTTLDPVTNAPIATVQRSINDVVGSQGISFTDFVAINSGSAVDGGTPPGTPDPVFNASRRVTGRNAPSVINAVFNYANFWDGRANNIFNGENPFGPLDQNAGIWVDNGVTLEKQKIAITNASLASQATGPPLNDVEMSFKGRTFPELGRKMLSLPPLGRQLVHPNDSVFSAPVQLSRATLNADGTVTGSRGLNASYRQMIQDAFQDSLWNSSKSVSLPTKAFSTGEPFDQIEANFSLFWGLAIQLYEATLVSDRAPFDRFQAGNQNALSLVAQRGLSTFDEKCAVCHAGSEFTNAVVGSQGAGINPLVFTNNTTHSLIREGQTNVFGQLSDAGFFNIGVRPTADDPGRGGSAAGFPLSFSRLAKLQAQLPFVTPGLPPFVQANAPDGVQGAFKTPGLRNVELTAPYFHNGSVFDLPEVVRFYARGGNFANPEFASAMAAAASGKLRNNPGEVVEFLRSLTDERVRAEKAPFDRPELLIPSGDLADTMITLAPTGGSLDPVPVQALLLNPVTTPATLASQLIGGTVDATATVAVSVNGSAPVAATVGGTVGGVVGGTPQTPSSWSSNLTGLALGDNSITITATSTTGATKTATATITVVPTATIGGTPQVVTKQTGASLTVGGAGVDFYQYRVDGVLIGENIPVATPIVLTGLADGTHNVSVLGRNSSGTLQQPAASPTTVSWTVKANPPRLTLNPVPALARGPVLTIGGTVELGLVPLVRADTSAAVGPVTVVGGSGTSTWSCQVSGLGNGATNITVTATDIALNVASATAGTRIVLPDGSLKGTGKVDVSDALKALRIAVGLETASPEEMLHGDVAPLVNNAPAPDDRIDVADALAILRKVVGLINF